MATVDQIALDFSPLTRHRDVPRARTTDPETSHAAAASVQRVRESQQAVLRLLRDRGPMTDVDIAEGYPAHYPKQSSSGLRTRRAELVARGLVRDSGERKRLASGRMAIVWIAVT